MSDPYTRMGKALATLQSMDLDPDVRALVDRLATEHAEYRADIAMVYETLPGMADRPPTQQMTSDALDTEMIVAEMCQSLGLDYLAVTAEDGL